MHPLINAIKHEHLDVVEMLLTHGAIPQQIDIITAIDICNFDIADLLLNTYEYTQLNKHLFHHCKHGNIRQIEYILTKPNININTTDKDYTTPIAIACLHNHTDIVSLLSKTAIKSSHSF